MEILKHLYKLLQNELIYHGFTKIAEDIWNFLGNFAQVTITHVYREINMVADQLAKTGHCYNNSCIWVSNFLLDVLIRVYFDLYGIKISRVSNF